MSSVEVFNACEYLLDRHVAAGAGEKLALTGVAGDLTYAQLHDQVRRLAAKLRLLGLQPEQRLLMFMSDSPSFVVVFLATMRIGAIPVPVSTMIHADDLAELLRDSQARLLAVTSEFAAIVEQAISQAPELTGLLASSGTTIASHVPVHSLDVLPAVNASLLGSYPTTADSPAFWLYTSGTTGKSKAVMHRHASIKIAYETYGCHVLGIQADDRCLSAAKAFFAYGLGNSVIYPLAAGATTVLEPSPSKPASLASCVREYQATLFFGGPTFFANMLREDLPADALAGIRLAVSAGEALPSPLYEKWSSRFGVEVLDGLGMTEMMNIFLSNRPGDVHPGTTGIPVPGYDLRIVDESGADVPTGTPGTLLVRGETAAMGYWARYAASRQVFQGEWVRTGDTFLQNSDGHFICLGRTDDMLKVSGIWVSPLEVEAILMTHESVAQAVVIGVPNRDGLVKLIAYVLLKPEFRTSTEELVEYAHEVLPTFKCPRRIVFVSGYPSTSTGKIRRVELRAMGWPAD